MGEMSDIDDKFICGIAFQFLSKIVRDAEISEDYIIRIPYHNVYVLQHQFLRQIQMPTHDHSYRDYRSKFGDSFKTTWKLIRQQYKAIGVTIKYCCNGKYQ